MRKSKINLAISREDYQKYETYFSWLRMTVFILGAIFLVTFLVLFFTVKSKNDANDKLSAQKQALLASLQEKSGDEAKILYLQKKYSDLKNYLTDDAFSAPYYGLLSEALKESSQSSTLKSFQITKNREVTFTISFKSFPELVSFFKFLESKQFLKNFEDLALKSFSVIGSEDNKQNYEISFAGKFIKLNEKN